MESKTWLSLYRRLWIREDPIYEKKQKEILTIYNLLAPAFQTDFIPVVFRSHNMNISRMDERKAILCDVHFFDIAQLIASSFYVAPTKDVKKLSNLLLANSFICSDDVLTAYNYANDFISDPYTTAFVSPGGFDSMRIAYSRQMQVSFALSHEMAHEKYQHPSGYHALISDYMSKKIGDLVDIQNSIAKQINAIDLSLVKEELDKIRYKDAFAYPQPKDFLKIIAESVFQFDRLYNQHSEQLNLPWEAEQDRRAFFAMACENYLRDKKESIFEKELIIEEAVCDIIALIELLNFQIPSMNKQDSVNHAIESYVLCLLAQDMILSAMSIQKDYMDEAKHHVDYIRMRLEKEALLFEDIIALYESLFHCDEQIDWPLTKEKLLKASEIAEIMYAEFSEAIYNIDLNAVANNYISLFDPRRKTIILETERLLTLPV